MNNGSLSQTRTHNKSENTHTNKCTRFSHSTHALFYFFHFSVIDNPHSKTTAKQQQNNNKTTATGTSTVTTKERQNSGNSTQTTARQATIQAAKQQHHNRPKQFSPSGPIQCPPVSKEEQGQELLNTGGRGGSQWQLDTGTPF